MIMDQINNTFKKIRFLILRLEKELKNLNLKLRKLNKHLPVNFELYCYFIGYSCIYY